VKRFTETQKWEDPWFRKLPIEAKLLWQWICDHCDQAGVVDPDLELASFQIGADVSEVTLGYFTGRIETIGANKIHILKFVKFQYGKLSRACIFRLRGIGGPITCSAEIESPTRTPPLSSFSSAWRKMR